MSGIPSVIRKCWACNQEWDDGTEHYECMRSLGDAWEFMEEAALLAIDERKSLAQAQSCFQHAKDEVKRLHGKAYQT